jgi:hypothetical protein
VTTGITGQSAEALQDVGNDQVRLDFGGTRERVVGVAFGLIRLSLRDRHAGARDQRPHQEPAGRHRDGVIGPAASRGEIPAGQCGLRTERALHRRGRGQDTVVPPGRLGRVQRRRNISGCQGREDRCWVGGAREEPAQLGRGRKGRVGRGPGRARISLPRECDALAREGICFKDPIVGGLCLGNQRAELCGGSG